MNSLVKMDAVSTEIALYSAFSFCSRTVFLFIGKSLYIRSGVFFTIKCNLPSEEEEFAQLFLSNSLFDGYHHFLLNQTAFGMCFTVTVPSLYSV